MLSLYLRHPGRLLLQLRQGARFALRQAARLAIWASDRMGLGLNAFAMFGVPTRVTEAPALASTTVLRPLNGPPAQSASNAQRLPRGPVIAAHFLLSMPAEPAPRKRMRWKSFH